MRRAKTEDVSTLLKLARMVHFINLPADRDIIADKVALSRRSFLHAAELRGLLRGGGPNKGVTAAPDERIKRQGGEAGIGVAAMTAMSDLFMFVLEDTESNGILGTSQIISRMGGPGVPNIYLQLTKREFFSKSLQQGGSHMVARLVLDESGPTEIGGLILQPSYRGHKLKLGRFLSLVRFHFIGLYRSLFSDRVLAELMAPLTPDGRSTLWEYLGRRFINLTYDEADRFCQYSKEFMISLLPREDIYLTLLPPEARSVVGEVGPETAPARKMLERLGFKYRDRVDPFDGGPNLDAATDEISLVKATKRMTLAGAAPAADCREHGIVSVLDEEGEFRAVETAYSSKGGAVRLPQSVLRALGVKAGVELGVTPTAHPLEKGQGASAKNTRGRGGRSKKGA